MANNEATLLIRIKQLGGEALDKITAGIAEAVECSRSEAIWVDDVHQE